jgi:hypothetical protein
VLGVGLELLAEDGDGHIDGAGLEIATLAEDVLEELGARDDTILVAVEPADDADLARGEGDAVVAAHDDHAREIDDGAVDLDFVEGVAGGGAAAEDADAGEELAGGEGFGDVVVGAFHEAADLVVLGAARGEHEDGSARTGGAEAAADLHAVESGEHQIEDDEIERIAEAGLEAGDTIADRGDLVPVVVEEVHDSIAETGFIFDHEHAHAVIVPSRRVRGT